MLLCLTTTVFIKLVFQLPKQLFNNFNKLCELNENNEIPTIKIIRTTRGVQNNDKLRL